MSEIKIEYIALSDIKPYENNPRMNDDAVKYVENSIKEFGFKVPIIIDQNNVIVAGHTRLKAAEKLNLEKVPCIRASNLNAEQIKAFRIAENKVSEFSDWDMKKLEIELEDINFDMSNFGIIDIGDIDESDIPNEITAKDSNFVENENTQRSIICPYCHKKFLEECR